MRNVFIVAVAFVAELAALSLTRAQGTFYVSNLNQASGGISALGSDAWLAQSFRTGTNGDGYLLNSVQLRMAATRGEPSGLTISLHSTSRNVPGINLGSFNGLLDPVLAGIYDFTAAEGITLSANSTYFIVATSAMPTSPDSYYAWSGVFNSSATLVNGWTIGDGYWSLGGGSSWIKERGFFQMAIYATAVPEPTARVVLGLGLAGLGFWRQRRLFSPKTDG